MTAIDHPIARVAPGWRLFAVFLALHGIAHLAGTTNSFDMATKGQTAEYLGGAWRVSDFTVLRPIGVAWAIVAGLYVGAALGFWVGARWRVAILVVATVPSLLLSVIALWASWIGVMIDVALLGVAVWLSTRKEQVSDPDRR